MEQILLNAERCRFEDGDFTPNPGWEKKGIAKFSDIENRLRSLYSNDLAKKQLDLFLLDGNVINKNNTVGEYKIIQNATINIKQVIN